MWPDWVSNTGPLTYVSGALPTAQHGLARLQWRNMFRSDYECMHRGLSLYLRLGKVFFDIFRISGRQFGTFFKNFFVGSDFI